MFGSRLRPFIQPSYLDGSDFHKLVICSQSFRTTASFLMVKERSNKIARKVLRISNLLSTSAISDTRPEIRRQFRLLGELQPTSRPLSRYDDDAQKHFPLLAMEHSEYDVTA